MHSRILGLSLALLATACHGKSEGDQASATASGKTTIAITAGDKGFSPASVDVKKGSATTLVFTRTTDDTCAKKVVFPDLKVTKELPLNQPVSFDVPSDQDRTLGFQCGMGMFKGSVVVK